MLEAHYAKEVVLNYAPINLRETDYLLAHLGTAPILLVQSVCMRTCQSNFFELGLQIFSIRSLGHVVHESNEVCFLHALKD